MDKITADNIKTLGFSKGLGTTSDGPNSAFWTEYEKGLIWIIIATSNNDESISVRVGISCENSVTCKGVTELKHLKALDELVNG